jgi:hypothetical protein
MYSLVGKGAPNEHLRWITGSRSQPRDDTAALVKGKHVDHLNMVCIPSISYFYLSRHCSLPNHMCDSVPGNSCCPDAAGMPDTDQELACVHVDVLAALYRVELAVGVAEQTATALSKQAKLQDSVERREAQSNIFGGLSSAAASSTRSVTTSNVTTVTT